MIEISLNKIEKTYGFNKVLNGISLDIHTGDIVTLIGENGSGKSTILNIISGIENVDGGTVSIRKGSKIGYLKQIPPLVDKKVYDILYEQASDIIGMKEKLEYYEKEMEHSKDLDKLIIKYTNLQEKFINAGGYEIDTYIKKIISGFKLENLTDKNYNDLSGGEKRVVSLASLMIQKPNILLLDEPTNHLDIDTLEWFQDFIKKYKGTILLVSHDRYFIDKVSNKVVLIERGDATIFHGNYTYYVKENELRIENEFKAYKDQAKIIEAMKKKIKKLEEFGRLAYPLGESFFRRAENIRKRLERIDILQKPVIKKDLPISFDIESRTGKDVVIINNYDLYIEDKLLIKDINMKINYKDKVCIMGNNGTGKSTLIKKIMSDEIRKCPNVSIGYIPQEINFKEEITILEYARKFYIGEESHLRSALNKFYFNGELVFKKITKLSGGEKVRLKLFELIQSNNSLIILDEPTNHIDIDTKEILEEALKEYEGTIIFISHDRYFINKLANKIFHIKNNEIKEYIGNYDDYLRQNML